MKVDIVLSIALTAEVKDVDHGNLVAGLIAGNIQKFLKDEGKDTKTTQVITNITESFLPLQTKGAPNE